MDRREAPGRKRMAIRSPDGAAPYLLTPNTLAAVSSPVPAHHLRALRVRAIGRVQPLAERQRSESAATRCWVARVPYRSAGIYGINPFR